VALSGRRAVSVAGCEALDRRSSALLGDDTRARLIPVTKETSKLLQDALKLGVAERAELASELIASLDAEGDEDAEGAWATEIEERAARARSGEDPGKPWPEVRDRLERDLKNR
jgi:putative addiction module component (TIGR02574 family)